VLNIGMRYSAVTTLEHSTFNNQFSSEDNLRLRTAQLQNEMYLIIEN